MTISMYRASVPVFVRGLTNLKGILGKAVAHAQLRKIPEAVLFNSRLYPDMFPLSRQVQIACDFAKGAGARLAGIDVPSYEDNEKSFPELKARIAKTIAFLRTLATAQIDGSETRDISIKIGGNPVTFKGQFYLVNFVLPNYYFHHTAAYAILRHNGVELGKMDFMARA
jgi:hypothetical protein